MRKVILFILLLSVQYGGFCQNVMPDALSAKLRDTKEDTAKLNIYLALNNSSKGKDNLLYVDSAWNLIDKLFLKENETGLQKQLITTENNLPDLVISKYSSKGATDWNRVLPYLNNRLLAIEKTDNKERAANFLYSMARIYLDGNKDSLMFRNYITRSIAIATAINDSASIVKSYHFMYGFYKSAGKLSEALNAIQSAIAICKKLNYQKGLAKSMGDLAEIYAEFGEDDLALENYQKALNISYTIGDTNMVCNTLISEAGFYSVKKNYQKALEYYNKALELNTGHSNMDYGTGSIYMMIGEVYGERGDYKNALLNFQKSLDRSEAEKDIYTTAVTLHNMGMLSNKQGNFDKAIEYDNRIMQLTDSIADNGQYRPYVFHWLAQDYYGLKKYEKAKELNDSALIDFKKRWFDIKALSQMELLASQIDSARGDGFGAFGHYKEYVLLNEKIKGEEIQKEAQKDKFKTAIENQKSEQEKKDAVAQRTRNLQYMMMGTFLLLGIFLLYGYIQKNKDKKRIEKAYSQLKSTQSQLIQSEKMASLGELTAGIAHEIQNPLNFVNNFSEVSNELMDEMNVELDKGDIDEAKAIAADVKQNLEKINHHGKRADAIVKGMLQHSQSSKGQKEPTDINSLCDEYLRLSYHGLRAKDKSFNATLKTDFDPSLGKINIIPQDIGRVVMNLLTNAFYAVNAKALSAVLTPTAADYEPTVSIRTTSLGEGRGGALITVSDNGNGIPAAIIDKIFQPFFTTKPTGQGTGLGLSLSYDIITKGHGGELKVETKENEGSKFIILLPAA